MADRTLAVQAALVDALKADAGVAALVGTRVYDRAPQGAAHPLITVRHVSTVPFDGVGLRGREALWSVDVWSREPGSAETREILAAIHAALHWASLTLSAGSVVFCRENGMRDFRDPDGVTTRGVADFIILTE